MPTNGLKLFRQVEKCVRQLRAPEMVRRASARARGTSLDIFLETVFAWTKHWIARKGEGKRRKTTATVHRTELSRDKDRPGEISWSGSLLINDPSTEDKNKATQREAFPLGIEARDT